MLTLLLLVAGMLRAQQAPLEMSMEFLQQDSTTFCKVQLRSGDTAVKEVPVKLYAQGLFGLLEITKPVSSDSLGVALLALPDDLPQGYKGKWKFIAKVEDNEVYANTETAKEYNAGQPAVTPASQGPERSFWGTGKQVPMFMLIGFWIFGLVFWGSLAYVIVLLVRLRITQS